MLPIAPELISPAGTLQNMRYAIAFGADAVYAGLPRYSLRVRNNDFTLRNLEIGIRETHKKNKKFYVTSNILPHNRKVKNFLAHMEPVVALQPDALIMADPGLIMLVRERWPEMPVHLSVQANTVNYASVQFWQSLGLKRVILSRELSLGEIEEIRNRCPYIELEVFVHGAICIAYSGRCLLSGYFNHRDPNQGTCTNSCRWEYNLFPAAADLSEGSIKTRSEAQMATVSAYGGPERHPTTDDLFFLEEQKRPGEYMPILEDEHGTYIMNSKDLRAVEHIERLVKAGVDSLKIEGRTKSHYYVARTSQIYRRAIDDACSRKPFNTELITELEGLANRGYTDGFFRHHRNGDQQNYTQGRSVSSVQRFVGEITGYNHKARMAEVVVKNKFTVGDSLELILPTGNLEFVVDTILDCEDTPVNEAPGSGYTVRIPVPTSHVSNGLLAKNLTQNND
jgi:putative protease